MLHSSAGEFRRVPLRTFAERRQFVAGVAGGVGTSTWKRAFSSQARLPIQDLGVFAAYLASTNQVRGTVDVLVTSNTATATAQLGGALFRCERPPLLVVMHTVPGSFSAARAYLRQAKPHITRRFDVPHQQVWQEIPQPPGRYLPKDFTELVRALPEALTEMYSKPPQPTLAHALTPDVRGAAPAPDPLVAPIGQGARGLGAVSWQQGNVCHMRVAARGADAQAIRK